MNSIIESIIGEIGEHEAAGARPAVDYLESIMDDENCWRRRARRLHRQCWEDQWLRAERLEVALLNAAESIGNLQAQLDEMRAAVDGALVTARERGQR